MIYYFKDGTKFTSKSKAIEHGFKVNSTPAFYYYDDIYDKVNWLVEPIHDLDYYYKQQALKIRDNHDYVILCYSGGYDSTNILETFYYNQIKLDKIITVGALKKDSSSMVDENHNGELYYNVFPYVEELGLSSITQVLDYTEYFSDVTKLSITDYASEWIDYVGGWYSPHHWFWRDIENYIIPSEYKDKRVALIFGKDKPYIRMEDGKYGFSFSDSGINSYGSNNIIYEGCNKINFYWDPFSPEILVKQLHVLLRAKNLTNCDLSFSSAFGHNVIGNTSANDIIYNLKKPIRFKSPKSPDNILSLRDNYMYNAKNSEVFEIYKAGIKILFNRITNNYKIPLRNSTKAIQSKFYAIH